MKKTIILMLILLTISMLSAMRATGYGISAPVTINTLLPPHDLWAQDTGESVILSWYAATMGTPDYFIVYGSNTPLDAGSFEEVTQTDENTYEDWDYSFSAYYVTSVYSLGESRPSNIAYVGRMEPISALVSIDSAMNSVVLSWDRYRDTETYLVYYTDNPHASFPSQWTGPVSIPNNRFIDPLADKRFYKVFARVAGRGSAQADLSGNPPSSKK